VRELLLEPLPMLLPLELPEPVLPLESIVLLESEPMLPEPLLPEPILPLLPEPMLPELPEPLLPEPMLPDDPMLPELPVLEPERAVDEDDPWFIEFADATVWYSFLSSRPSLLRSAVVKPVMLPLSASVREM